MCLTQPTSAARPPQSCCSRRVSTQVTSDETSSCGPRSFLDAERYPEIRFESTKVEPGTDRDTLRVTGSLTVKDTTREIVLDVSEIDRSCSPSGEHVAYYSALTNIDRLDFRVDAMRLLIGRKLQVMINVQATRPS